MYFVVVLSFLAINFGRLWWVILSIANFFISYHTFFSIVMETASAAVFFTHK